MTLVEQLIRDEGCKRVATGLQDYRDSKGYWTRGYGHLLDVDHESSDYVPKTISEEHAMTLLYEDIEKHRSELYRALPWLASHNMVVQDAVLNMTFNLGITRLRGFTRFIAELQARNYTMAVIEMLDSKWHREDVGPRAVRLAKQIATRVYR